MSDYFCPICGEVNSEQLLRVHDEHNNDWRCLSCGHVWDAQEEEESEQGSPSPTPTIREEIRQNVRRLARERYPEHTEEEQSMVTFLLLLDVADTYLDELETNVRGSDDPAPYLGGTTPLQCLLYGLEENLRMLREER